MAAGDRHTNGKAKDLVYHFASIPGQVPLCGNKKYGLSTNGSPEYGPVTCKKCLKKLNKENNTMYKVIYTIDIDADSALEAAKKTHATIKKQAGPVFLVTDVKANCSYQVDLEYPDIEAVTSLPK
jgi:hypothetical protein